MQINKKKKDRSLVIISITSSTSSGTTSTLGPQFIPSQDICIWSGLSLWACDLYVLYHQINMLIVVINTPRQVVMALMHCHIVRIHWHFIFSRDNYGFFIYFIGSWPYSTLPPSGCSTRSSPGMEKLPPPLSCTICARLNKRRLKERVSSKVRKIASLLSNMLYKRANFVINIPPYIGALCLSFPTLSAKNPAT